MNPRMLLGGVLFSSLSVSALAQTDISVLEAYVCNGQGGAMSAKLGEDFWVRTQFRVAGTPNSTFKYRVETPFGKVESPRLSFGTAPGDYWVYWGPFPAVLDETFQVKVTLDPERKVRESNRSNNVASFSVSPQSSAAAREEYAPQSLAGRIGLDLTFRSNSALPTSLSVWMPKPVTETFQQAQDATLSAAFLDLVTDPFGQPLLSETLSPATLAPLHEEMAVSTSAHAVRSNRSLLRQFPNSSDPDMAMWLQPEMLIELQRPEFLQWVNATVPVASRLTMSTIDVAEALYRSILKKCTYQFKPGVDPSAYQMLRKKKGDCGAMSSLFVALCRTAGIPARTVAGFGSGRNNWHIWAEFHVNGAGWIPVDPAYAEGRLAKGSDLPLYFGVIPELNERVATAFGLDRKTSGLSLDMLQSPAVFWFGRNVKIQKLSVFSELTPVG